MKTIRLFLAACFIIAAALSLNPQNCFAAETSGPAAETKTAQYIFNEFEKKLQGAGIEYTVETFKAESVGALDGRRYKIGNGRVEMFFFDVSTEDYRMTAETGRVTLKEYHVSAPVVQNGAAFMFIDNLNDIKTQLIPMFNAL